MTKRIYLTTATLVSALALGIGAIAVPTLNVPEEPEGKATLRPVSELTEGDLQVLVDPCISMDEIMFLTLNPALESLSDTRESRSEAAIALRTQAPVFEKMADSIPDEPLYLYFDEFAQASNDLADTLDSDASAEETQPQFDAFNKAGQQLSEVCFAVFENLNSSK